MRKYCLTGMLLLSLKVWAQDRKPLLPGDLMPTINISTIYNSSALSSISFPNNKLVILDFMATTCSGCIKALPRFDSLQKQFKDHLHILLVSFEKNEKIKKFFIANPVAQRINLPVKGEDSSLTKLFPHLYLSHEAWIYKGKVIAITGTEEVTAFNIQQVLSGNPVNLPLKNDMPLYDYSQSLLAATQPAFYSVVTGYMNDASYKHKFLVDTLVQGLRIRMYNQPVISLYLHTYGRSSFQPSFMVFEMQEPRRLIYSPRQNDWILKNGFCYEALLPLQTSQEAAMEKVRSDLAAWFGIYGKIEKRTITCIYYLSALKRMKR